MCIFYASQEKKRKKSKIKIIRKEIKKRINTRNKEEVYSNKKTKQNKKTIKATGREKNNRYTRKKGRKEGRNE